MFIWKSRFLTHAEVWFQEAEGDTSAADWVVYHQCARPIPGARSRPFYTYAIDLTRRPEQLEGQLTDGTAYKIRRARERDGIVCECCDSKDADALDRFHAMYNAFAAAKGLGALERARIDAMSAAGHLDLSAAKDKAGNVLVYHGNFRNDLRATELYSTSLYRNLQDSGARNLISRANRLLVWSDLRRYQAQGLQCFDFGGWYPGTTDAALLKINEFKAGFGGQVLREYLCERILTIKGWCVLQTAKWLKRTKLFPAAKIKTKRGSPLRSILAPVPDPSA